MWPEAWPLVLQRGRGNRPWELRREGLQETGIIPAAVTQAGGGVTLQPGDAEGVQGNPGEGEYCGLEATQCPQREIKSIVQHQQSSSNQKITQKVTLGEKKP